ncbi:DUF2515 family protein [Cohnella sp. REN36]|uniref:DUF2515 family protein n=1 Tax=Cohnella sp. REN36 TaxID=2887347 RepID=UPI001D133BA2|nr:DUF2515 family protein [Cohnella sp. REN36]MCC3374660.1 DUF2515 domain-containing protein [Cohnella sp. REN36]
MRREPSGRHDAGGASGRSPDAAGWARMARRLTEGFAAKAGGVWDSLQLASPRAELRIRRETAHWAEEALRERMLRGMRGESSDWEGTIAELVRRIREETEKHNRNNITRTAAYLAMFRAYPELHWALLAHLVSRNGGWSMTDLKGQWLPTLLAPDAVETIFAMLEACNALIFRDAYPQLLLYAESRRSGQSRFGLLPAFGVSAFMTPFWERFWIDRDAPLLTVALIVNEQHVIEGRVVRDPAYRSTVLSSLPFLSQRWLQLNQVVFPLAAPPENEAEDESRHKGVDLGRADSRLSGRVLERFDDIRERIAFGKSLYAMLFAYPKVNEGAVAFAKAVPHTGSRADYWPRVFAAATPIGDARPSATVRQAGWGQQGRWRSPAHAASWPDRPLAPPTPGDWLTDPSAARYLLGLRPPLVFEMTREHAFGQRKLQAAVMTKLALLPDGERASFD